jgi:hypothetical protein
MKLNNLISQKCQYYIDYINSNDFKNKLCDPNKPAKYDLAIYLHIYFLFQKSGTSYDIFYDIFEYAALLGPNNYPKRTALHTFKLTIKFESS